VGAVGQDNLKGVVFGEQHVVVVQEGDLKRELVIIFVHSVQVVLRRHFVALVPVDLPTAADWEARLVESVDKLLIAERVGGRYVANEVVEVEILNVPGVLRGDLSHAVLSVFSLIQVDSAEFAL